MLRDSSLGYHNIMLDERSSCLKFLVHLACINTFAADPVGDMFQQKMDGLISSHRNVFDIANDILISGLFAWVQTMLRYWRRYERYAGRSI